MTNEPNELPTKTELKKMNKKVTAFLCRYYDCRREELDSLIQEDIKLRTSFRK